MNIDLLSIIYMILINEINIDDILILNKLKFKFKLPLFKLKNHQIYWRESNYITFEFTVYVKPYNCNNPNMHILNQFSLNPIIEYEQPLIQKLEQQIYSRNNSIIEEELLFDYVVCDINTFTDNFYFLNKSHVDYLINIKVYLLNFDDILMYNISNISNISSVYNEYNNYRELFNSYNYAPTFYLDDTNNKKRKYEHSKQEFNKFNKEEYDIEPPAKKIFLGY